MVVSPCKTTVAPLGGSMAKWSCQACKMRKRRCSKELPQCRLCIRGRRQCSYQSECNVESLKVEVSPVATRVSKQGLRNDFPVAFFLDPALFNCCAPLPASSYQLSVIPQIADVLGDRASRTALAVEYFKKADRWLPIISQIRFFGVFLDPARYDDPGITAILLAMKLVLEYPEEPSVCSDTYLATKEFQLLLEMSGHLTLCTVQSALLIAMYEMGHAIYPGAFTTISTCARYATALGINETLPLQGTSWVEQEERNRTWWAIGILDCFQGQHLCRPDPRSDSILPVDQDAWDQGVLPENQARILLSTPCLENGRYARLAQASNLLSQVYRHLSCPDQALRLDLDNIAQLERTIFALENLACYEGRERKICCLSAIATCYSSILLLHTAYLSEPHEALTEDGKKQSRRAIREVLSKTSVQYQRFLDGWCCADKFPPFALDWLYRAAVAHIFLAYDAESSESTDEIEHLKQALKFMSKRWQAATHYLRLLETRQTVRIPLPQSSHNPKLQHQTILA